MNIGTNPNSPVRPTVGRRSSKKVGVLKPNLALSLLLLSCVAVNGLTLFRVCTSSNRTLKWDAFSVHDPRLQELRSMLPRGEKVGFMPGHLDPDSRGESTDTWKYFRMRYALVPVMLEFSTEPDLIVGDFTENPGEIERVQRQFLLRDFGDGIVLLRRKR